MSGCLTASQIDDYLRGALSDDGRRIVESHVEACAACHDALVEREIEEILPPEDPTLPPGPRTEPETELEKERRVGPYRLIHELGRGGQASVYLVEDTRLPRRVALKVFQSGFTGSREVLARVQREAAALSRLDHPGICTVYETGVWEGCPFIAMRYVKGETLARRIAASIDARVRGEAPRPDATMPTIRLIEQASRALHTAHEAGLVHRDIKPSNIIITGEEEPVLVDFGLARDEESTGQSLTRTGDLPGTPAYMSPEQIRGERALIDRRSDVFSLGVTLYEALTLSLPFDAPTTAGMFHRILSGQLSAPSRASRNLPRDLRVILQTALESDRLRRYQTALAFAEDLRRYREHQTILARPAGPGLRFRRWTQRNPVIAVSILAIFLILATALAISVVLLDRVRIESDVRAAALRREEGLRLALQSSAVLRENPGQALLLSVEAAHRAPSLAANNALMGALESCHERVRLLAHRGSLQYATFSPDGLRVVTASWDQTARVWDAGSGKLIAVASGHKARVRTAEFSPDGSRILTAAEDGSARIWDATSGEEVVRFSGHVHGLVLARFSPDGSRVVTIGRETTRIWDAATGASLRQLEGHKKAVLGARFSPDGTRVVTCAEDSTAIIWEVASGQALFQLVGHEGMVLDAQWSGSGRQIITAPGGSASPADVVARIWEAGSGRLISALKGHEYGIYSAVLDADGELAATGGEDFTVRIWEARTGKERFVLRHDHKVIHLDLARDGRRLLTASYDRTARIWDVSTGKLLATLRGHAAPLNHASFSPDGSSVVTSSVDYTARVWSVRPPWPIEAHSHQNPCASLAILDPSGRLVATTESLANTVVIFAASTGAQTAVLSGHKGTITALEFSPDGHTLLTASNDSTARLWNPATGELRSELAGHTAPILNARFSANGRRIATASDDHTVRVWDAARGAELARVKGPERPWLVCSLSPDGRRVVCGAKDGILCLADADGGESLRSLEDSNASVRSAEWSPDGRRIVVAAETNRVQVRDAATGASLGVLVHASRSIFASYSPDGRWIATLCQDWITRIWDARTHEEALNLKQDGFSTSTFSFVSGGKELAILGYDSGQRQSQRSRILVYPLDPLTEALKWHPGAFTPDERDKFLVGSLEERAAKRAAWNGGDVFGSARD